MATRFLEWTKRPARFYPVVAALCVIALALGYFGVDWYQDRFDDPVTGSSEVLAPAALDASPSPTPDVSQPIVVHGTGDVNLDPDDLSLLASGYEEPWAGVRDLFRSD